MPRVVNNGVARAATVGQWSLRGPTELAKSKVQPDNREMHRAALAATAISLVLVCQAFAGAPKSAFDDPARLVGRDIRVCGFLRHQSSLFASRSDEETGFSLAASSEGVQDRLNKRVGREICVSGKLEYVGCRTDQKIICVDWEHDYLLRVRFAER